MAITFQESGLKLVSAPSVRPISLSEARDHLRVTTTDEDDYIELVIKSATDYYERFTWLQIITAEYELFLDEFPIGDIPIELPRPPFQSITDIKFVNEDGVTETWANNLYELDTSLIPGLVRPINEEFYPDTKEQFKAVTVKFKAGYGDSSSEVPDGILHTLKLIISFLYDHRDFVIPQRVTGLAMPQGIVNMIQQHSVTQFI